MIVELVYDPDCPNVDLARAELVRALAEVGLEPSWRERRRGDADFPPELERFGSPAVLVDGEDVTGAAPATSSCCRVYDGARAPPAETIARALRRAIRVTAGT
jgi:hypothetical protein